MSAKTIYLILVLLSVVLVIRIVTFYRGVVNYPSGAFITWQTQLLDQPKLKTGGQQITLSMPNSQRVVVKFQFIPLLSYGDKVQIAGKVEYFKTTDGKSLAFMSYPKFELLEKGSDSNLLVRIREDIINLFNSTLPPTYSSLMLGIVFGIKQNM